MDWMNLLKKITTSAADAADPSAAASRDRKKSLDSLIQSRQFQDLLTQTRTAAAQREGKWAQEDRALLTPEERKQKELDPYGRRFYNKSGTDPRMVDAETIGKYQAVKDKLSEDTPASVLQNVDNAIGEITQPYDDRAAVDIVRQAFEGVKSPDEASMSAADKTAQKALIDAGLAEDKDQAAEIVLDAVGQLPSLSQTPRPAPTDNRGLFTGGINPFQQQAVPSPKTMTFVDLGINDPQAQQMFSELETKVPNLRELYAASPDTYQRLFAAIQKGQVTLDEVVAKINELYGNVK